MKTIKTVLAATVLLSVTGVTQAALYDRGNGMIYDSSLNITWLQDANYAQTSGYDADGQMTWGQATTWAANLVYGGYSDWRLSSARLQWSLLNPSEPCELDNGCQSDLIPARHEIGSLLYQLGNTATRGDMGLYWYTNDRVVSTFTDAATGLESSFINLSQDGWWEAERSTYDALASWLFSTGWATQGAEYIQVGPYDAELELTAWAVRDGDVASVSSVPVPATAWLFGTGLIGLLGVKRKVG